MRECKLRGMKCLPAKPPQRLRKQNARSRSTAYLQRSVSGGASGLYVHVSGLRGGLRMKRSARCIRAKWTSDDGLGKRRRGAFAKSPYIEPWGRLAYIGVCVHD